MRKFYYNSGFINTVKKVKKNPDTYARINLTLTYSTHARKYFKILVFQKLIIALYTSFLTALKKTFMQNTTTNS